MSRQLRGSGNVFLRGRTWWVQYCVRGRVHRESARSTDRNAALRLLRGRLAEAARGQLTGPTAERLTLAELMQGLENEQRRRGNRTSSRAAQERWIAHFGARERVLNLTATRIAVHVEERRRGGLSNASANRDVAVLRRALNVAVREGRLSRNHLPSMPHYHEENVRQGFMEPADFSRLRDGLPAYLRDAMTFLYLTGWRIGEVRTLEWRDVDLDGRAIRLRAENSKNKRPRTVKLWGEALDIIRRAHERRRLDCRYVFHRVVRSRQDADEVAWPLGDFRKAWRKAIETAGLNKDLIRHDFRRSAIRNGVRAGIPEVVMMQLSGHRTRSVFDRYHIVSETDLDLAAQRMDEYVRTRQGETPRVVSIEQKRSVAP